MHQEDIGFVDEQLRWAREQLLGQPGHLETVLRHLLVVGIDRGRDAGYAAARQQIELALRAVPCR